MLPSTKLVKVLLVFGFLLTACGSTAKPTSTFTPLPPTPTAAPPTSTPTPAPTNTPVPTATPAYTHTPIPTDTPAPELSHAYDGYWMSETSNRIIQIQDNQGSQYRLTQVSCAGPMWTQPLMKQGSKTYFGDLELSLKGDELDANLIDGPLFLSFKEIPDLPDLCKDEQARNTQDPVVNFEALWRTYQENYAFFEVRGIDWQAQYDQFRPQVKADMSQAALYSLMLDMLAPIQDAHVFLYSQEQGARGVYKDNPSWLYNDQMWANIITGYLGGYGNIKMAGNGQLDYGKLNDSIGYINVKGEAGYAPATVDDAEAAAQAIDQAIQDIGDVKAMIVDTRFNGGGEDSVSLALASRFTDQRRVAFSYALWIGDSFAPAFENYLEPGGKRQFTKPVYVLTSNYTVSSGETFVLAMRALPNVTLIGERTRGCFAMDLFWLPNDWLFGVTDLKVIASDGAVYEGVGIPPDIEMAMSYDLGAKDEILEKAIALAGENK